MTKQIYDIIKIEIAAEQKDIDENELTLSDMVQRLEDEIETWAKRHGVSHLLSIRVVPEWEEDERQN